MVGNADDEEPSGEDRLSLRVGYLALVESGGGLDLSETGGETVEGSRRAGDDEVSRSVMEGDLELRVRGQVGVRLSDVALERLEGETGDGQHGHGCSLAVLDGVLDDRRLDGEDGEGLLTSKTDVEEELERLEGVGGEVVVRVGRGDADGRDDTLRVTGRSLDEISELSGRLVGNVAGDEVLDELGETNEGKRERDGGEVGDRWPRCRSAEPSVRVEPVGVERVSGLGGLGRQRDEDLLGGLGQETSDVRVVDVEEVLELIEVDLQRARKRLGVRRMSLE